LKRVDGCPPCLFFQLCLLSLLPSIFGSLGEQKLMVNEQIQQALALLHQGMWVRETLGGEISVHWPLSRVGGWSWTLEA
jgi:hypothetical protein